MGTPSATVYVDYVGTPHTFIKLDDGSGNVKYYGFAPATPGSFSGLGKVGVGLTTHALGDPDNSKAGYIDDVGYSKTISLSTEQFNAMKDRVGEWQGNSDAHYNAVGTNCTAFVKDVLEAGNAKYEGIGWGPNPMNLIPVNEQGPLFTTNSDGVREFSDRVRDPANTPGTRAYEYRQQHPDEFEGANAPKKSDLLSYDLYQDASGNWVERASYAQNGGDDIQTDTTTAYTEDGHEVGSFTTEHQPNTLPSSDAYATVLQKVADQNSTLDDQALEAAEIRAVAGAQGADASNDFAYQRAA